MTRPVFHYGVESLSLATALGLARGTVKGVITQEAAQRISASSAIVDRIVREKRVVYGVTTGFGPLCSTFISPEDTRLLQHNLLISHSVGVGQAVPPEYSLLMLALKVQALAQGHSGVARETVDRILWFLERRIAPVVPEQGSVGASGDLAPLSHLFLPLIGLGEVFHQGRCIPAAQLLQREGLAPLELGPKEAVALINGTQFMSAHAVFALERFLSCLDLADIIGAMTLEGLLGSARPFEAALHNLRPYLGTRHVAHRLHTLVEGSEMLASHRSCGRVQDPYSLRCMPQVHGAARNAWLHLMELISIEINSVTDNPLLFEPDTAISGGNFHGEPIAIPFDYAAIAASELGVIADRRIYLMLLGGHQGLPKLLLENTGLNSGFMIAQYTTAALASENKTLCHPSSADSIPTSLGQEDIVSMGAFGVRKLHTILGNVERILGIELLCAAQAMEFRRPMRSSPLLEACHAHVRERIPLMARDRVLATDCDAAHDLVRTGELAELTCRTAGELGIDLAGDLGRRFTLDG